MSEHQQKASSAGRQDYVDLGYELLGEARRESPRLALSLPARCLFADGCEALAMIHDASASGFAVDCYRSGKLGEPVVVAIEHLDRFDGRIVRCLETGFAVELRMTPYRQQRLRQSLEELAEAERVGPSGAAPPTSGTAAPAASSA